MVSTPPVLHPLEADVMDELWSQGEATVRSVVEELNRRNARRRSYSTVLTVMVRLDAKGVLVRRRVGRRDVYSPVYSRDDYRRGRATAEVDAVLDEYGDLAFARVLDRLERLDPARRRALRRFSRD